MQNPGHRGDVGCGLCFGVDLFRAAAIAFLFGQPGALGVMDVLQLGLKKAAGRPVLVKGGGWRKRDPDGRVIARELGRSLLAGFLFALLWLARVGANWFMAIVSCVLVPFAEDQAIGTHGGERQQIEKGLRGLFARGGPGYGPIKWPVTVLGMDACSKTLSAPTTVPFGTHGEMRMAGTRTPRRSKLKV